MELNDKYSQLRNSLREAGKVLVAYSGGVDSTFLLKVAFDVLGSNALGVIGVSETVTAEQIAEASKVAEEIGVTLLTVDTEEFHKEEFVKNPKNRCFHCKQELFTKLWQVAEKHGIDHVLDGCNADDAGDYRPGMAAGRMLKVRSPLLEAGMTKEDIRIKSYELGLSTWNKLASPCLSSRFPYGIRITLDGLDKVEKAEQYLRALGFAQVRARYHENMLRIEVDRSMMTQMLEKSFQVVVEMKQIGFQYVTLDLAGYRMGSANEMLNLDLTAKMEGGHNYGTAY